MEDRIYIDVAVGSDLGGMNLWMQMSGEGGMKIRSYSINSPMEGVCKQWCILAQEYDKSHSMPLVYLQRPKWITSDKDWETIVRSINITLPAGVNIK